MLSIVWLLFVGINIAAAITDVMFYRIPNMLVVALLALFAIAAAAGAIAGANIEWLSHLGAGILVLGAGIFLYALKQMGAGDVKLLAALAVWAGVVPLIPLLFFVSLFGLGGMLVIVLLRLIVPRLRSSSGSSDNARPLPRLLTKGQGIPYGVAIAPGAIIASFSFAPWLWQY